MSVDRVGAQTVALRNNLLYDATLTPNLGADIRVDSLWTIGVPFHKSYVEGDLIYSHFNVGNTKIPFGLYSAVKDRRLQGDLVALGGKYGYSWILARHWRIEAEAGIAVGYAWFKEYECATCGKQLGNGDRIFLLPQLGINVVYIIN